MKKANSEFKSKKKIHQQIIGNIKLLKVILDQEKLELRNHKKNLNQRFLTNNSNLKITLKPETYENSLYLDSEKSNVFLSSKYHYSFCPELQNVEKSNQICKSHISDCDLTKIDFRLQNCISKFKNSQKMLAIKNSPK